MIRIGDFARLARVSVETLRHYDEVGILHPARVDQFTGYRYYEAGQLATVFRILALKDLGFSLAHIASVFDEMSSQQLQELLEIARDQASSDVATAQHRLTRITARLRQLQEEQSMSEYEVVLKDTRPTLIAYRRITIPTNDQVGELLGAAYGATYAYISGSPAKPLDPCLAVWHQPAAVLAGEVVDAAVPIDRPIPSSDAVDVCELPAQSVASVIHRGSFATMDQAHAAILSWLEANGYTSNGTYREIYIEDSPTNPEAAVTEIQYPVVRP